MELVLLGGSAAVTGVFSYLWFKKSKTVAAVKDAPLVDVNQDLPKFLQETPDQVIPYAVIQGYTSATNKPIPSQYAEDILGVIQSLICREHKTEWSTSTRIWYDKTRAITDRTKVVPFAITSGTGAVHVQDPLIANPELEVIYDKFEPAESSLSEHLLSWASGEKTKGFQQIELMLPEGVFLTGIGELALSDNRVTLRPPSSGLDYFLSSGSRLSIIRSLQTKILRWKLLSLVFGSITLVLIIYILRKWYLRYTEQARYDNYLRRVVDVRASEGTSVDNGEQERGIQEDCVICISRPRDCVLLDCGHVCACSSCVQALQPPQCPICRQRIIRVIPLFHA